MLFNQALQAMQSRKLGEAEAICRRILAGAPKDFDALHLLAVICSEKGEYEESERLFRETTSLDPNFPPGFYNYGSLLAKQKKYIDAVVQFDIALSLFPNFAPAHCDRGSALNELGRLDEALGSLNIAANLAPNAPVVWYNKANVHFQKKDYHSALDGYGRAVEIDPNYSDGWLGRGNAFAALERYDEAVAAYNRVLTLKPDLVTAWLASASIFYAIRRYDDALVAYDKATRIKSDSVEAWLGRANTCIETRRFDEAFAAYDRVIALNPDLAEAWLGRGHAFTGLKRYDAASVSYDKALALKSDFAEGWLARGDNFNNQKRVDKAMAAYDKALALKPDLAEAWLGRGNVFKDLGRYEEALAAYDKAHALKPDLSEAQCNEALIRLTLGDTESGWKKFEYRWDTKLTRGLRRNFPQRLWLGDSDIKNKTILIHAEQGIGDTLMACRYVPMIAALGAKVIVEVQPPLKSLLKNLQGISLLIAQGEEIPPFDVQSPFMSLPLAFKTTMETIPAQVPYLAAREGAIEKWRSKLNGAELKVGVAWAGNPNYPQDQDRSILLKNILPILEAKGARFFSLQKDLRHGDKEALDGISQVVRLDQEINDFEDTAAIMSFLDLVISSDTAVVHLAGALGRPVWVLLQSSPDWRWFLGRGDSPWYPTAKLFRQTNRGEWSTVTDDVCVQLGELVMAKKAVGAREKISMGVQSQ